MRSIPSVMRSEIEAAHLVRFDAVDQGLIEVRIAASGEERGNAAVPRSLDDGEARYVAQDP